MGVTGVKGSVGQQGWGLGVERCPGDKGLRCAYMANLATTAAMAHMAKTLPNMPLFIPC